MTAKRFFTLVAMTIMLATATAAQDADSLYAKGLLQPGTEAPDFTLASPDGSRHSLSSLRGSYVVLDFWASWCPDCRKDIPEMKRLHAEYGDMIKFVSVSFDDKKDNWTRCIADNGITWLNLSELKCMRDSDVARLYNVKWIPSMHIIDRQGRIILSTVMIEKLAAKLKELHEL